MSNAKTKDIFNFLKKKISWSQMIQKCLIRREMKKKIGGRLRFSAVVAVRCHFFKIYVKIRFFSFLTYVLRLKLSLKITDYMKVAKLPSPLKIFLFSLKRLHFSVIHSQFCCYAAGNCTFSHSTALKGVEEKNYLLR